VPLLLEAGSNTAIVVQSAGEDVHEEDPEHLFGKTE
jgi:hypothetical protein